MWSKVETVVSCYFQPIVEYKVKGDLRNIPDQVSFPSQSTLITVCNPPSLAALYRTGLFMPCLCPPGPNFGHLWINSEWQLTPASQGWKRGLWELLSTLPGRGARSLTPGKRQALVPFSTSAAFLCLWRRAEQLLRRRNPLTFKKIGLWGEGEK